PAATAAAGRRMNSPARPSVASRPSTSARRPASAPQASSRYAARAAEDSMPRARPKSISRRGEWVSLVDLRVKLLHPLTRHVQPGTARKKCYPAVRLRTRLRPQGAEQPGAGVGPDGVVLSDRHLKHHGSLFDGKPGEVVQLDQLGR